MSSPHMEKLPELDLGEPSQELLDWAKENINEDPATVCQKISDLRDMIYNRGECIPCRIDDTFLLLCLRARYFVVERAHRLFVNYHHFREDNPELFENMDLSTLRRIADDQIISVPPYIEGTGRRILLYRIGLWDPQVYTMDDILQSTIATLEMALLEPRLQILGGICIFDFGGLSKQHVWQMTPSVARKVVQIMSTSFPARLYALHIVNQSYVFDLAYNMFKPFLNETMKERIFFHGEDMASLHKHIDSKFLPRRYGGMQPDVTHHDWIKSSRKNTKFLAAVQSLGYKDAEIEEIMSRQKSMQ